MARPKLNDTRVIIRLPAALAKDAKRKARAQRRALSDVLRDLLRVWLGQ